MTLGLMRPGVGGLLQYKGPVVQGHLSNIRRTPAPGPTRLGAGSLLRCEENASASFFPWAKTPGSMRPDVAMRDRHTPWTRALGSMRPGVGGLL